MQRLYEMGTESQEMQRLTSSVEWSDPADAAAQRKQDSWSRGQVTWSSVHRNRDRCDDQPDINTNQTHFSSRDNR